MLIYTFYNADLIDITKGKEELSTGFVDDCAFVAVSDTLTDTHATLKHMMERVGGSLKWSCNHNLPFELTKLACMDFPWCNNHPTPSPLSLTSQSNIGIIATNMILSTQFYKYLGVTFDTKLNWNAYANNVTAIGLHWT